MPVRDRLLRAADELFYRDGINSVGIDAILARAGVAKASMYAHFRSKDDLVVAVLEARDTAWWSWFPVEVRRRSDDPAARLVAVFDLLDALVAQPGFRGCAFINAAAELADDGHPARTAARVAKSRLRELFRANAVQARLTQPSRVANTLLMLADGVLVAAVMGTVKRPARHAKVAAAAIVEAARGPSGTRSARVAARPHGGGADGPTPPAGTDRRPIGRRRS